MKYKVIAFTEDVILANKNNILCVREASLSNKDGDSFNEDLYIGRELSNRNLLDSADIYWKYTKKEWQKLNKEFALVQLQK